MAYCEKTTISENRPIASIQGFAQVLLDRDVPPQEQEEYLSIIIKESKRLTDLATNVLYLSKIEQQTILTDKKASNICEQIRGSIIALDMKWAEKPMEFQMDSEEDVLAVGNEELQEQVWINLLYNAIKLSTESGMIIIAD
ncbi:MAG: two-component sensor histidine kinase, partial [Lachnospiraceae bacterium]|nr:two-component sensor histidine kinase [Lachnospiraceae bacterium]